MSVTESDQTGWVKMSSGSTEMGVSDVPESEERPSPQQAERISDRLSAGNRNLNLRSPGRLGRRYRNGDSDIVADLSEYLMLIASEIASRAR